MTSWQSFKNPIKGLDVSVECLSCPFDRYEGLAEQSQISKDKSHAGQCFINV